MISKHGLYITRYNIACPQYMDMVDGWWMRGLLLFPFFPFLVVFVFDNFSCDRQFTFLYSFNGQYLFLDFICLSFCLWRIQMKRFLRICLDGIISKNCFSCKEKHIMRRMQEIKINNNPCIGNCYKFWSGKVRGARSQSIGEPLITHLNANAWLQ